MHVWLSAVPYIASLTVYISGLRELFYPLAFPEPRGWQWRVARPVLIAGLTPLAVAGTDGPTTGERTSLIALACAASLVVILIMTSLHRARFSTMKDPFGSGERELTWLTPVSLVTWIGVLMIVAAAVGNIWVGLE
jgi:protein-S-isoprenylcysteine O-methyltransferase Ste14